ncbi:hypothetical protein PVAND_009758 [Polypedilum vanderplanki]|uniref:G-protein coupled receptors family 1 profile domain-containing protein n=1 Tax=Polypedilum vanderplanki TaxID=319348 RepID=A0A9J6CEM6_POLVA|nr:hypothetical protein PVAND_009758 [Polypedilum vanderplanki]
MTEPYFNISSNGTNITDLCFFFQNCTTEDESYIDDLERSISLSVFILFGFIFIAGLIGNGLVVLVVAANPLMRSTTNILIINLAVADLLFVIFCIPFTATDYILNSWPFGSFLCSFVQYMIIVTCHASVYTLVLMSVDRYIAIVHPISGISIRTEKNATLAIGVAWLFITTCCIPWGFAHGLVTFANDEYEEETKCIFSSHEGYNHPIFQISFFLSSYVVPLTLISVLYVCMLLSLWKGTGTRVSAESRRGKKRVTRMIVAVVLAFAACWLPIHIILVLKSINAYHQTTTLVAFQIISHVLAYTNSCINPILYCFLSENFRKAFRKVVNCGSQKSFQTQVTTKIVTRTGNGHKDIL